MWNRMRQLLHISTFYRLPPLRGFWKHPFLHERREGLTDSNAARERNDALISCSVYTNADDWLSVCIEDLCSHLSQMKARPWLRHIKKKLELKYEKHLIHADAIEIMLSLSSTRCHLNANKSNTRMSISVIGKWAKMIPMMSAIIFCYELTVIWEEACTTWFALLFPSL